MIHSICRLLAFVFILPVFAGCVSTESHRDEVEEQEKDKLSLAHEELDTNLDSRNIRLSELNASLEGLVRRVEKLQGKTDRSTLQEVSDTVEEEIEILEEVISIHRAIKEDFLKLVPLHRQEAHNADMQAMEEILNGKESDIAATEFMGYDTSEMLQRAYLTSAQNSRDYSVMHEGMAKIFESFENKAKQQLIAMRKQREHFLKLLD